MRLVRWLSLHIYTDPTNYLASNGKLLIIYKSSWVR